MDSVSPRRDGSMLAASSRRADSLPPPAHSANALRDVLRRWRESDVDQLEHLLAEAVVGRPRRGLVPVDADQSRVHPRDGPEHRRRHHAVPAHLAVEPDLGAGHAVVLAAGLGGEPLGDLGLHHHHHGADRREVGEQVQQRGNGDVVRQVRDQRGRLLGQIARLQRRARRGSARVSRLISLCECSATVCGSWPASTGSISTAVTLAPRSSSASVSDPRPGPDLEDVVLAVDSGCRNHTAHGVCVVNEVLAERLTRPEIQLFGEVPNLGTAQQSDGQDAPTLPLHTGHAPQP